MNRKMANYDADSLIYKAACVIQENPIVVTHKINKKRQKEFKNITEWREFLKSNRGYDEEDFEVATTPRLKEDISHALYILKNSVEKITSYDWVMDYHLFVGGKENFRKELATILPYKGQRTEKPLAYQQCYDYLVNKYKDRLTICEGEEGEDGAVIATYPEYLKARKARDKDVMCAVVASIDKDVRSSCPGWHFNYDKPEEGVVWLTDKDVARNFCYQMLIGDRATDNIPGCTVLGELTANKYGIRKGKGGIGPASAEKILFGDLSEKEMVGRVVEVYKDSFKDEWTKHITENAVLLKIRRFRGELFDFVEYAKSLGVEV